MTTIIAVIVAMTVIVGLVVLLYKIGVSREGMIMAALIAGLLFGGCIGTCFGEFEQRDQYDQKADRSNYFYNNDPRTGATVPGYYASTTYNTTPTSTQSSGWNWSAISNTVSSFFSGMGRWLWPSSEY